MRAFFLLIALLFGFHLNGQSEIYVYKDTLGLLTYEEITSKEFKLLEHQVLEPHNHSTYWFKVPSHSTNSEYRLTIYYDRYQKGEFYQNGEKIENLENQRYLSYRFSRGQDAYLKIAPKFHAYIPVKLQKEAEFLQDESSQLLLNGFYYGFAILIIIYNLSYYFVFRDLSFLYYALFLTSMSLGIFIMDGMLTYWGITGFWNDLIMILNYIAVAFFSAQFGNHYLSLDLYYPQLRRMMYGLGTILIILGGLFMVFGGFWFLLFINLIVFTMLFSYWGAAILMYKRNVYARILTFAYIIILFSGIDFFILKFLGIKFPLVDINAVNIKIGGFLEMIALSVAVLYRMYIFREENIYMRNEIIRFSSLTLQQNTASDKLDLLSIREREIFDLISQIKTNKEIANELNISVNTVKFHIKNIYGKLEVKNRKEVLSLASNQ